MKLFSCFCNSATLLLFVIPASAQVCSVSSFQSFNAASAGSTSPSGINVHGVVAGIFSENVTNVAHGFVRTANGRITLFDVPRAFQTVVKSINARGEITGFYFPGENHNEQNGFVRDEFGNITPFGVPGAADTVPLGINGKGVIVGTTNLGVTNGDAFIRAENGEITTFRIPGTPGGTQAVAVGINDLGDIGGSYYYFGPPHGFVRTADGAITTFDAYSPDQYTEVLGINNKGQTAGYYTLSSSVTRGFVREASGTIKPIEPPGSTSSDAADINNNGYVVGSHVDANGLHAYVRGPNGGITPFDVPGASLTRAYGINDAGEITGIFVNADPVIQGFLARLTCH
jgi:hypothetical protein